MFLPFSRRAKAWEPHANKLRAMVGCSDLVRFDPMKLAPKVGLTVHECTFAGLTEDEVSKLKDGHRLGWSGERFPRTAARRLKAVHVKPNAIGSEIAYHSYGRDLSLLFQT